jgi:RNA polymerase sigma-70 factor (ECF subfamily)
MPFTKIAETLNCSTDAARQHASRARKALADADPPSRVDLAEQQEILGRFLTALSSGDMSAMVSLLHPDVVVVGDSGGKARTAFRPITGPEKAARFALGLMRRYGTEVLAGSRFVLVNGDLGFVTSGRPGDEQHKELAPRVTGLAVRDGQIIGFYDMVNPDKLTHVEF